MSEVVIIIEKKDVPLSRQYDNLLSRNERDMRRGLRIWFAGTIKQVRSDLIQQFAKKDITTYLTDWKRIEDNGKVILKPVVLEVTRKGGQLSYKSLGVADKFDVTNPRAVANVNKHCAKLVREVTTETKKGIRTFINAGIKQGKGMPQIARELRPIVGLTKRQVQSVANYERMLKEAKLPADKIKKKVRKYRDRTHRRRMQTIARTETARAQNFGYVQGLEEIGINEVEFLIAAGACDICINLNTERYSLEDAEAVIPVHPNCRCAMLPVINDRKIQRPLVSAPPNLPGVMAPVKDLQPWRQYLASHRGGDKNFSAVLYDWYKLNYEATGKLSSSAHKFLLKRAKSFEAASVKIKVPIPGVIRPPVIKPPPDIKPPTVKPLPPRFKNTDAWLDAMTREQKKSVTWYTHGGYMRNKTLQKGLLDGKMKLKSLTAAQKLTLRHMQDLEKILQTSPKYTSEIWRGKQVKDAIYLKYEKMLERGDIFSFERISSYSGHQPHALEFALKYRTKPKHECVMFHFKKPPKTTGHIRRLSAKQAEDEYLVGSNSRFKITGKKVTRVRGQKLTTYEIKEIVKVVPKPKPLTPIPPKPGILPKSYYNEAPGDWEKRLSIHKADLRDRLKTKLGFDIDDLKLSKMEASDVKEAVERFKSAVKSYTKPTTDLATAKKNITPSRFYTAPELHSKQAIKNATEVFRKLEEIGCDDLITAFNKKTLTVRIESSGTRAHASPKWSRINIATDGKTKTYFHEIGHLLESNPNLQRKARMWVAARGKNAKVRWGDIRTWVKGPNANLRAYKNKFIDSYVGKIYPSGDTEALSVGLQQFTSYKSMLRFAKKDFDHFAFIHGILTGAI